jgi:tight adherence protein B
MRPSDLSAAVALGATALAVFVLVVGAWDEAARALGQRWQGYASFVGEKLRLLYLPWTVRQFALRHALAIVGGMAVGLLVGSWFWGVLLTVVAIFFPRRWLMTREKKRREAMEAQLDSALQTMANTILVTQNLTDAWATLARNFEPPLAQEADFIVKEVQLGTPIDAALREWAERMKSRPIDSIVTALTVGRLTGGDLPKVLNATAVVLRETMRIDGVLKTKTAEGKTQAIVIAVVPVVFGVAMAYIDPEWMRPLFADWVGWLLLGVACLLEAAAMFMVRKITQVDV